MIELINKKNNLELTQPTGSAPIEVDDALSLESANPVQNRVITEKFNEIEGQLKSPWEGKTAVFYGDSLTEKNYHYTKGYHQWVKEILGLESYINYGVSGYKLSDIYNKIQITNTTADIVFVMGGVNDLNYSIPLGSASDRTTVSSYGSLNLICETLREKYPTSIIVFITPHYQTKYPHSRGITSYEISKAIKEVCERYAITVYDNYTLSTVFASNLKTYTTDNCHWNDTAHELVGKNLAEFILNTFPVASTYSPIDYTGRTITVEKNSNDTSNTCHLTALIAVDEDCAIGNVISISLTATDPVNVIARTSTGGPCYYDETGILNNGSGTNQLTEACNHELTITDNEMTLKVDDRVIAYESRGEAFIKVPLIVAGTVPYSFKISDISIKINGKEKTILGLGAFFASDKEIIKSTAASQLFNMGDGSKIRIMDKSTIALQIFNADNNGKEFRYIQDITSINLINVVTNNTTESEIYLSFRTGETAPTYSTRGASTDIRFTGTDVVNNTFSPKANTAYNMAIWWDGLYTNVIVRGVAR